MADLLIKGGHVIDPAQNIDAPRDILVTDGRIEAVVAPGTVAAPGADVIDASGKLVIPGMIDTHAHVFQYVTGRFGLNPDLCGVRSGVTTLIDQGGPSCMTLPAFREHIAGGHHSRTFAFLSTYLVGGLEGHYYPSLYKPDCVDVEATVTSALANADLVKGFKAHAEIGGMSRWGLDVMRQCAEIGKRAGLPLYIHFGQLWPLPEDKHPIDPDSVLRDVVPLLKPGDILAHPFTRHPGGFVNSEGRVHPMVREALERGLKVDVGHGSHFSFKMARIALDAGIVPHTLGADMHGYNTHVPHPAGTPEEHTDKEHMFFGKQRFSLASAMTSMLALGLPLMEVVKMVTTNVVANFGLPDELGSLTPGNPADISVLNDHRGRFSLRDNEDTVVAADRLLSPAFCLVDGVRHDADAPILPDLTRNAV
ncbi:amidohydrolase/deacetylase family metallohydrolase [Alloalcanivorax sp. C16-2]|uniref:amidohydrolase/deacetylase family metallohydrolase n=1 Tax=Alloalcanivorax TaxID=3020832 RepID=UPI001933F0AE|nr:amidohydrolase/deacetylase family metallohydrolase [Alloalcanivorax marinus]MBL7252050.1 amidohydrolase/deacetylase family metallohydrolase [Alloalcanivorax marinus]